MKRMRMRLGRVALAALTMATVVGLGVLVRPAPASAGIFGFSELVNAERHRYCVDIRKQHDYYANLARAQLWTCTGVAEQQFVMMWVGDIYGNPNLYQIKNQRSQKCLIATGRSAFTGEFIPSPDGNQVAQYSSRPLLPFDLCSSDPYAHVYNWELRSTGEIVMEGTNACLDITGDAKGAMLMTWTCNGNLAQRWLW